MSPGDGDFRNRKLGEMTTVPRRVGRQVTGGLVAVIAAVSVALAGESSAGAATYPNSAHRPRGAAERDIGHLRHLRDIRNPPDAKRHRTRPTAGKARRHAGTWTVSAPSVGLAADLMTLSGPDRAAGVDSLSLPVPPLARGAPGAGGGAFTA